MYLRSYLFGLYLLVLIWITYLLVCTGTYLDYLLTELVRFTASPTGSVNNQPVALVPVTPVMSITNLWLIVTLTVSIEHLWPFSATECLVAIFSVLKYIGKIPINIGTTICNT